MKRIQLLQPTDYWTQRKDSDAPGRECQVTSGANYLMALGLYPSILPTIPFLLADCPACTGPGTTICQKCGGTGKVQTGKRQRLPDYINDITDSPEGFQMAAVDSWKGDPSEDHRILTWAINKAADRVVNVFRWNLTLDRIFLEIAHRRPVIISGLFGQYRDAKGEMQDRWHVVCLTGVETSQDDVEISPAVDLSNVTAALVADPYGDFHTNYQDQRGAECRFTVDELRHILHDCDQPTKWGHLSEAA